MTDTSSMLTFPIADWSWSPAQVRTYGLAIGAPSSTMDDNDLELVAGTMPTVFPTFAVLLTDAHSLRHHPLPGVTYSPLDVIYASHELELFGPLPSAANGNTLTRLETVGDITPGVLAIRESTSVDAAGSLIARNRVTSIIRGKSIGIPLQRPVPPAQVTEFDHEIEVATLPQQALLYSLTGDENPLHLIPSAARAAGFERPILHGLCSYAMAAHALLRERAHGRWTDLRRVSARFTSPVFPGETLLVRSGRRDNTLFFEVWARETNGEAERKVMSHGELRLAASP